MLLGSIAALAPMVATAEIPAAQENKSKQAANQQLNKLLEQGRKLVDAGNWSGAIALYQKAAKLEKNNPRIYSGIGYLQGLKGDFSAAAVAYRQAVALEPASAATRSRNGPGGPAENHIVS